MSTRSGKRIHNSFHETATTTVPEPGITGERKTRSKRIKEEVADLSVTISKSKKRNNYVSFPTEDEVNAEVTVKQDEEVNPSRGSRKTALREQNDIEDINNPNDAKNLIRKSRRFKKLSETNIEPEDHENVHEEVIQQPKSKKNKKKKRSSTDNIEAVMPTATYGPFEEASSKKSKKKKKKGKVQSSIVVEDVSHNIESQKTLNKSNTSVDSFHSAAGSPVRVNSCLEEQDKQNKKAHQAASKNEAEIEESLENTKQTKNKRNKKRKEKPISKDSTFDKSNVSMTKNDVVNEVNNTFDLDNQKTSTNNATFDKNNVSVPIDNVEHDNESKLNTSTRVMRKSSIKNSTFDKSNVSLTNGNIDIDSNTTSKKSVSDTCNTTYDKNVSNTKEAKPDLNVSNNKIRKSNITNITFDKDAQSNNGKEKDTCLNVSNTSIKLSRSRRSTIQNATFDKATDKTKEKDIESFTKHTNDQTFDKSNNGFNATFEKDVETNVKDKSTANNQTYDKNDTYDKDGTFNAFKQGALKRKSSIIDATFDKSNISIASLTKEDFERDKNISSSSAYKRNSLKRRTFDKNDSITEQKNATFDKTDNEPVRKSLRRSQSITDKLNTTFDKGDVEEKKSDSKSSLISSDNSNITEKSNDISRISITSDDTTENIINTTPVLIESSMDESLNTSKKASNTSPVTPLKREGTFTKDTPEVTEKLETPTKWKSSIPAAGCTPYHVGKSSQKKRQLNVTRSIEKGSQSLVPAPSRMTRVMFCSPVDNPVMATTEKRKIIKSNLKGSNKSFVFEDSASIPRPARKRSYTQSDADDARAKRTRLAEDLQQSVDRLSRPRTASATAKLTQSTPVKKLTTPSKSKSEGKPSRTKLPNFAALHQRQFDKMESLDECQERRAKRAKQLLTPTGATNMLERISPKNATEQQKKSDPPKPKEKTDTPTKKLPTLESLKPGFTRFGFKLNLDVNPFSIPSKKTLAEKPVEKKPKEKPNGILKPVAPLPSLTGATSVRREVAKLTVMREKSFTDRRNVNRKENRTIIKGVRTNRRFELQMKLRNID